MFVLMCCSTKQGWVFVLISFLKNKQNRNLYSYQRASFSQRFSKWVPMNQHISTAWELTNDESQPPTLQTSRSPRNLGIACRSVFLAKLVRGFCGTLKFLRIIPQEHWFSTLPVCY